MKFVAVLFIVCAAVMINHLVEGKQKGRKQKVDNNRRNERIEKVNNSGRKDRKEKVSKNGKNDKKDKLGFNEHNDISGDVSRNGRKDRNEEVDTLQCKAGEGICKHMCDVNEEDTGSCCNNYRCCQPPACNETLQYAQCKARNGENKPVCDVNEQDTGIGPFCNDNRCCEPPSCIAKVDCNCKNTNCNENEYKDNIGNCSGSDNCCKPCCPPINRNHMDDSGTCGGIFNGPVGSFTSPNFPSDYCNSLNCYYNITVEEGSKVMLTFTLFYLQTKFDFVKVYDGEITAESLLDTLGGGPKEGIEFNSTSNKIIIYFESDGNVTFPGFSAIYKTLQ